MSGRVWGAVVLAALGAGSVERRTVVDAASGPVLVDVSVRQGRQPVPGLGRANFVLKDNGVVQPLDDVATESLPIDVSLVVDTSASVAGATRRRVLSSVEAVAGSLDPKDRLQVLTARGGVRVESSTDFSRRLATDESGALGDGGTALFDALALTLMQPPSLERRHLIIALTDGVDTNSVVPVSALQAIVERSDAVVSIINVVEAPRAWTGASAATRDEPSVPGTVFDLTASMVTSVSGGRLPNFGATESLAERLNGVLTDFRTRYLLRYTPRGVDDAGWHDLRVEVIGAGNDDVRARKGYRRF
jgi:VWFA-related protein